MKKCHSIFISKKDSLTITLTEKMSLLKSFSKYVLCNHFWFGIPLLSVTWTKDSYGRFKLIVLFLSVTFIFVTKTFVKQFWILDDKQIV